MNLRRCAILILILSLGTMGAHAATPHAHGEGGLDLVVEQDRLSLSLSLPLDAVVGFERAPRNAAEKTALETAARLLGDASLFVPSVAAACTPQVPHVTLPAFAVAGKGHAQDHGDIEVRHEFRCARPAALKGLETTLFSHFKRLYRIEARRVGPSGQGATRLTPKQPRMSW